MADNRDRLSLNRFKDRDTSALNEDDYLDFIFAKLMSDVIQSLEVSIQNDRAFSRARFNVMQSFWSARESLDRAKQQDDPEEVEEC